MVALKGSGADTFINISTPKFAAQSIRKAADIGWKPAHYLVSVSLSISSVLKPAGLDNARGVMTASYLREPSDPSNQRSEEHTSELQSPDHLVCRLLLEKKKKNKKKSSHSPVSHR